MKCEFDMKLFPGAKIHIWTDGPRTLMKIQDNRGGFMNAFDSFESQFTVLSDTEKDMGCNIYIEISKEVLI